MKINQLKNLAMEKGNCVKLLLKRLQLLEEPFFQKVQKTFDGWSATAMLPIEDADV